MKKGFTLIELLAVIVILAIIAVIAVPIVVTIINDSTSSTTLISGEFYINAVETEIMNKNIDEGGNFNPIDCLIGQDGNVSCGDTKLTIEVDGERPVGGFLKYNEGKLVDAEIKFTDDSIVMNKAGELASLKNDIVCTKVNEETKTTGNIPNGEFLPGDEYICKVNETKEYHFFVLSSEENKINMIMERNMADDGIVSYYKNTGLVVWYSSTVDHSYGPVVAMNYLHNATKNWDNIPNIVIDYKDENIIYSTQQVSGLTGYGEIKTTGNITVITSKTGEETLRIENLKSRLPNFDELASAGCTITKERCPLWLVNYLSSNENVTGEGLVNISGINGYWTSASNYAQSRTDLVFRITQSGYFTNSYVNNSKVGVRPVISISKANIY